MKQVGLALQNEYVRMRQSGDWQPQGSRNDRDKLQQSLRPASLISITSQMLSICGVFIKFGVAVPFYYLNDTLL
ncbi:hypothetical protein CJD36_010785 [Flavipsychrobacter stenotrophus]|uniref:Uncharacterized protein n=1 Tax=Flavipsychrobacter stenotrophus TaxID=2077091 RepID=A0A2S7SU76_9BACT|nr:hypothetical protein CJD36_010785 [Flavipsychrobacter stenotrophus]